MTRRGLFGRIAGIIVGSKASALVKLPGLRGLKGIAGSAPSNPLVIPQFCASQALVVLEKQLVFARLIINQKYLNEGAGDTYGDTYQLAYEPMEPWPDDGWPEEYVQGEDWWDE